MKTIADIRREYPQYQDMSDEELGKALHSKYYADMPYDEFAGKAGIQSPGMLSRAGSAIASAWRGNAAEEAPQALTSGDYLRARSATQDQRGWLDNVKQEGRELGAAVFGNDQDLTETLVAAVDGAKAVTDANGNPMIELPDGKRVYANQPGMDGTDVLRFAGQLASYLPAARIGQAIGGGSTLARAGMTGLASAATNAAGQAAAGRDQIDAGEVAFTGVTGAAGEVIAPAVAKVWGAAKQLFSTGASREQAAVAAARAAGIERPTNAQVQSLSRALGEIDQGADPAAVLQGDEFGFLYTTGQRMSADNPRRGAQLAREEFLRSPSSNPNGTAVLGDPATILQNVDNQNAKVFEGIVQRGTGGLNPAQQFGQVQTTLREQRDMLGQAVKDAYQGIRESGSSFVGLDGLRQMPQRLRAAVRDFRIDPQNFPATSKALQGIEDDLARLADGRVSAVSLDAIESQRRVLNNQIGAAANRADRAALTALKREFDNTIDDVWESSLRSGDPAQLEALKQARALRAQYAQRFQPENEAGDLIDSLSSGTITPDEAVAKVIGVTQVAAPKAIPYIQAIKKAAGGDRSVIEQLQAAHFANLMQDSAGNILLPGRIAANIQRAERNTGSLIRELYTPDQWAQMRRLADASSRLTLRGPDANVTGGGRGLRGLQQMLQSNAWLGTVANVPGVQWAVNAVQQGSRAAQAASAARGAMPVAATGPIVPAAAATQGANVNNQATGGATNRRP